MDLIFTRRTIHSIIRFDFHFFYVTQYSFLYQQREKRNILIFTKTCPTWKSSSRCHSKTKRHNIIHITYIHKRPVNKQKNIYIIVFGREKKSYCKTTLPTEIWNCDDAWEQKKKKREIHIKTYLSPIVFFTSPTPFFLSLIVFSFICVLIQFRSSTAIRSQSSSFPETNSFFYNSFLALSFWRS